MASKHPHTRAVTGVPGVKALITTSALAVTLGGWGLLSITEAAPPSDSQQAVLNSVVLDGQQSITLDLTPIPTIVPAPNIGEIASTSEHTISLNQAPIAPQPNAPAPLREVNPPSRNTMPAPVTTTRSSR